MPALWRNSLETLRNQFEHGAARFPGLRHGPLRFLGPGAPHLNQLMSQWREIAPTNETLELKTWVVPGFWFYGYFGTATSAALQHYKALAKSAFGCLLERPADALMPALPASCAPAGDIWWSYLLHAAAARRPTPTLNSRQTFALPVPEGVDPRAVMAASLPEYALRTNYEEWRFEPLPDEARTGWFSSTLAHDVFLSSAFAIDRLLHSVAAEPAGGTPPTAVALDEVSYLMLNELANRSRACLLVDLAAAVGRDRGMCGARLDALEAAGLIEHLPGRNGRRGRRGVVITTAGRVVLQSLLSATTA